MGGSTAGGMGEVGDAVQMVVGLSKRGEQNVRPFR